MQLLTNLSVQCNCSVKCSFRKIGSAFVQALCYTLREEIFDLVMKVRRQNCTNR